MRNAFFTGQDFFLRLQLFSLGLQLFHIAELGGGHDDGGQHGEEIRDGGGEQDAVDPPEQGQDQNERDEDKNCPLR